MSDISLHQKQIEPIILTDAAYTGYNTQMPVLFLTLHALDSMGQMKA